MTLELSCLMDNELKKQEGELLLDSLQDETLRQQWMLYHMVGEGLREEGVPPSAALSSDFMARFSERLAAEDTIQPAPVVIVERRRPAANQSVWRIAAAVVGVVVALGAAISLRDTPSAASPSSQLAQVSGNAVKKADVALPMKGNAQDYLLAHQAYSPSGGLQGLVPYARTVSLNSSAEAQR